MRAAYLLLLRTISGPGDATARRPRRPGCVRDRPRSTDQEQDLTPVHPPAPGARAAGVGSCGGRSVHRAAAVVLQVRVRGEPRAERAKPATRRLWPRETGTYNIRFIRYIYTGHRPQCSDHRQCSEFSRHTQTGTQIHTLPARRAERVPRVLYNELTKYIVIRHL